MSRRPCLAAFLFLKEKRVETINKLALCNADLPTKECSVNYKNEDSWPKSITYTDTDSETKTTKTCGKTAAWLNGKLDCKCISQERRGLTCYHSVCKICEDYAKEKVKSYDYKHDRNSDSQYFQNCKNTGAKVYL